MVSLMNTVMPRPAWLDPTLYPFESRVLEVPAGRLHYVDEGPRDADPVLFVHGTPTWSFLWRDLLVRLRGNHRCVALDHLGFGLSDKPSLERFEHTPAAHAENLGRLVEHLDLRRVTLVVHDFGGPIGLGFAVRQPERVAKIVVLNSWAWSNEGDAAVRRLSGFLASALGRFLYLWCNAAVRLVLPMAFSYKAKLTRALLDHYRRPFARRADRVGPWSLGRELWRSNAFYEAIWNQRGRLAGIPLSLVWATRDVAFKARHLARWREAFPRAEVVEVEAGHFLQEEAPERVERALSRFLAA